MILLTATRIDAYGHFTFRIETEGAEDAVTDDALEAAKILAEMGVDTPFRWIGHVRDWGSVEISLHSSKLS